MTTMKTKWQQEVDICEVVLYFYASFSRYIYITENIWQNVSTSDTKLQLENMATQNDKQRNQIRQELCISNKFDVLFVHGEYFLLTKIKIRLHHECKQVAKNRKSCLQVFSSPCQRQRELLPSLGVRSPLTFHILIFSSETPSAK